MCSCTLEDELRVAAALRCRLLHGTWRDCAVTHGTTHAGDALCACAPALTPDARILSLSVSLCTPFVPFLLARLQAPSMPRS